MIRVSRAGRKNMMLKVLKAHNAKWKNGAMTTAQVAHAVGLKSSTNVVKMLREMADDELIIEVLIEPYFYCGYTVRAWQLATWEQISLPDRTITINGITFSYETGAEVQDVAI